MIIIKIIFGLGIFIYGIFLMGDSLKKLAGDKIKKIIGKLTNNMFTGILTGFLITSLIQSSSGTTAITISLVRANLMSFPQAIGIIMGANIGTTTTSFLLSFPQISNLSPFIIGFSIIPIFLSSNIKINNIGKAILGFGLLFYGMNIMSINLREFILNNHYFYDYLLGFSNHPLRGLLTGIIITTFVQSSSASVGIIQSLYSSKLITLKGALPIIYGNNIGTTITAIIASIGGSITAKKTALFHVIFNFLGAIIFMILLDPFYSLISSIIHLTHANLSLSIAYSHLLFNVITTIILIWFINYIIKLIEIIIPEKKG